MAYAVTEDGKRLICTVYETEQLAKYHFLAYCTGDYSPEEFYLLPGRLDPCEEFNKYPSAHVVPVSVKQQFH